MFSIDNAAEETSLELVQNFTSLLILLELDNLVAAGLDRFLHYVKIDEVLEKKGVKEEAAAFVSKELTDYPKFHKQLRFWKFFCGLLGNYHLNWILCLIIYAINLFPDWFKDDTPQA